MPRSDAPASDWTRPPPRKPKAWTRRTATPLSSALFAFHSPHEICEVTGCSLATAYQWKAGIRTPGPRTLRLWRLFADEQVLTEQFRKRGFRVRKDRHGDCLILPSGHSLTINELEWYRYALFHAAEMARRIGPQEQARWWDEVMAKAPLRVA